MGSGLSSLFFKNSRNGKSTDLQILPPRCFSLHLDKTYVDHSANLLVYHSVGLWCSCWAILVCVSELLKAQAPSPSSGAQSKRLLCTLRPGAYHFWHRIACNLHPSYCVSEISPLMQGPLGALQAGVAQSEFLICELGCPRPERPQMLLLNACLGHQAQCLFRALRSLQVWAA